MTYTGVDKYYGEKIGLWDVAVKREKLQSMV